MRRLNVLLVEDDDDSRALYGYMLASSGYKVKAVTNGLEALAEIQVERPDVILTDLAMPVLSGVDLIKAVKKHAELTEIPIVAMTAYGNEYLDAARKFGAYISIDKPTEIEKIREVVSAAFSHSVK